MIIYPNGETYSSILYIKSYLVRYVDNTPHVRGSVSIAFAVSQARLLSVLQIPSAVI